MAKKDNEIESEKSLDEQLELDKKDVSENSDSEEEMIREILSQNVTKLKKKYLILGLLLILSLGFLGKQMKTFKIQWM